MERTAAMRMRTSQPGCAHPAPVWARCVYKTAVDATLSAAGRASDFYHFLIDFAPRVAHAMARDGCASATVVVPGWAPLNATFAVTIEEGRVRTTMQPVLDFLFPDRSLDVVHEPDAAALCALDATLLPFSRDFEFDQPVPWLESLRERGLRLARAPPLPPPPAQDEGRRRVQFVRRSLARSGFTGARRRRLPAAFFTNASAFCATSPSLECRTNALEEEPLRQQVLLFASARVVLGLHGAGLAHIVFSPRGAQLVELGSVNFPSNSNVALRTGHTYHHHRAVVWTRALEELLVPPPPRG